MYALCNVGRKTVRDTDGYSENERKIRADCVEHRNQVKKTTTTI